MPVSVQEFIEEPEQDQRLEQRGPLTGTVPSHRPLPASGGPVMGPTLCLKVPDQHLKRDGEDQIFFRLAVPDGVEGVLSRAAEGRGSRRGGRTEQNDQRCDQGE
jgi:hypothetical protein